MDKNTKTHKNESSLKHFLFEESLTYLNEFNAATNDEESNNESESNERMLVVFKSSKF